MTLIEVVAGLALLGTLLVGILVAQSRHLRQSALAERRLAATAAADRLVGAWWKNPASLPRNGTGVVPESPDLAWRTRTVTSPDARAMNACIVRLEIIDAGTTTGRDAPLVSLELLLPSEVK